MTETTDGKPPSVPEAGGLARPSAATLRRFRWPLAIAAAVIAVAVAGFLAAPYVFKATPPPGLVESLRLPKKNNCGEELVQFKRKPHLDVWIFPLDGTWHHTRPCLDNLLVAAAKQPPDAPIHDFIYNQVLFILSQKPVRFYEHGTDPKQRFLVDVIDDKRQLDFSQFDRIVYVNNHDVAHNSMSHVDLMIFMFAAAENYLTGKNPIPELGRTYEAIGNAVISVVTDTIPEKGLRTRTECDLRPGKYCSWFHAVTNRYRPTSNAGGTLNKFLQVIRDLNRATLVLDRMQEAAPTPARQELIDRLRTDAGEGINQLAYSSGLKGGAPVPSLFDYIAVTPDGKPIADSWLFYAINVDKKRGYFLQREYWKNCSYHIKDMLHLYAILNEAGTLADTSGLTEATPYLGGKGLLDYIVDTYTAKLDGPDGLYKDFPHRAERQLPCLPRGLQGSRASVRCRLFARLLRICLLRAVAATGLLTSSSGWGGNGSRCNSPPSAPRPADAVRRRRRRLRAAPRRPRQPGRDDDPARREPGGCRSAAWPATASTCRSSTSSWSGCSRSRSAISAPRSAAART